MGKYINSKFNDQVELYLIDKDIKPKQFSGHEYMLWNNEKIREFREEKGISKDARLTKEQKRAYLKWLEYKVKKTQS
jgi:hypothetical protein